MELYLAWGVVIVGWIFFAAPLIGMFIGDRHNVKYWDLVLGVNALVGIVIGVALAVMAFLWGLEFIVTSYNAGAAA